MISKRKRAKRLTAIVVTIILMLSLCTNALACTTVIVGKEASDDGSVIISRNEDYAGAWAKRFIVVPRREYKDGEKLKSLYNGFEIERAKVEYKYTAMPDWDLSEGRFYAAGINEYNVSVTATNTHRANEKAEATDPFNKDGIGEPIIVPLLLPRIQTAKDGVDLFGKMIEEYGADGAYGIVIADKNEAWYLEVGSGHRWVAVRVPDDKTLVVANELRIDKVDLSDTSNYKGSKDLITFAEENGLYDKEKEEFDFAKAYGVVGHKANTRRVWWGQHLLTPSVKQNPEDERYPLFTTPDQKVSVKDVMNILRSHMSGTKYDPDTESGKGERAIGVPATVESHVIQLRDDLPEEIAGLQWICFGGQRFNTYLPFYGGITDTPEPYKKGTDVFDEESAYWTFRSVAALGEMDIEKYGKYIAGYWDDYENQLITQQTAIDDAIVKLYKEDKEAALKLINDYCHGIAIKAIEDAKQLKRDVITRMAEHRALENK